MRKKPSKTSWRRMGRQLTAGASPAERRARAGLPLIRFMQASLPVSLSNRLLQQGMARLRLGPGVSRAPVLAGGTPCEWLVPDNPFPDQALVYLHGGGFVLGQTPLHMQMAACLAQKLSRRILMVDYRLAPEHPFPAALDDCLAAYRWLLEQGYTARSLALAGDSAGGNLAIATLMKLRDDGDPLPAAAACLSPVIDLRSKDPDQPAYRDPLLPPKAMRFYTQSYVGQSDPCTPLISPAFGDWRGLPPLLLHAGEDEILREDAQLAARLAQAAGVQAHLEIYPRMWHVWQLNLEMPQAVQSLDEIAEFLETHLG